MKWPFSRWFGQKRHQHLLLLECRIHGSHYYQCLDLVKTQRIQAGEALCLQREPNNEYDPYAIEALTTTGEKLGYVPKNHNLVIATLMDQGCKVTATITAVDPEAWEPVSIRIEWHT